MTMVAHLAETAVLFFAVFMTGCVIGYLARFLTLGAAPPRMLSSPALDIELTPVASSPTIRTTPAQRLAASIEEAARVRAAAQSAEARAKAVAAIDAERMKAEAEKEAARAREEALAKLSPERQAAIAKVEAIKAKVTTLPAAGQPRAHSAYGRPLALAAPRAAGRDDLKEIKGIGPRIERGLNELGVFHHDQIAAWDKKTEVWVDTHFNFKGRVAREKWVRQAKDLVAAKSRSLRSVKG